MHVCVLNIFSWVQLFATLWTVVHQAPLSMGFSTGVSCHAFLQGIFLTQGLNPCLLPLLHSRQILYHWPTKEAHIYIYKLHYYSCFILTLTLQTNCVTVGVYVCNYYHLDAEIPPMMSQSSSVMNFKPYLSCCIQNQSSHRTWIISIVYRPQTSYFQ